MTFATINTVPSIIMNQSLIGKEYLICDVENDSSLKDVYAQFVVSGVNFLQVRDGKESLNPAYKVHFMKQSSVLKFLDKIQSVDDLRNIDESDFNDFFVKSATFLVLVSHCPINDKITSFVIVRL